MTSMTLIVAAEYQADANAIAVSLNHDVQSGHTYSVPLSSNGQAPATHYGCRAWVTPGFTAMIEIAKSGVVPPGTNQELTDTALWVRSQWPDVIGALIADAVETDNPAAHWSNVIAALALHVIMPEPAERL